MRLILGALLATLALNLSAADGQWIEDFAAAKKLAAQEQRLILLDFTGSDWCQPCKMLHQRYYDTTEFKSFAKKNLVLVLVDFPFNKEQSAQTSFRTRSKTVGKLTAEGRFTMSRPGHNRWFLVGFRGSASRLGMV